MLEGMGKGGKKKEVRKGEDREKRMGGEGKVVGEKGRGREWSGKKTGKGSSPQYVSCSEATVV